MYSISLQIITIIPSNPKCLTTLTVSVPKGTLATGLLHGIDRGNPRTIHPPCNRVARHLHIPKARHADSVMLHNSKSLTPTAHMVLYMVAYRSSLFSKQLLNEFLQLPLVQQQFSHNYTDEFQQPINLLQPWFNQPSAPTHGSLNTTIPRQSVQYPSHVSSEDDFDPASTSLLASRFNTSVGQGSLFRRLPAPVQPVIIPKRVRIDSVPKTSGNKFDCRWTGYSKTGTNGSQSKWNCNDHKKLTYPGSHLVYDVCQSSFTERDALTSHINKDHPKHKDIPADSASIGSVPAGNYTGPNKMALNRAQKDKQKEPNGRYYRSSNCHQNRDGYDSFYDDRK